MININIIIVLIPNVAKIKNFLMALVTAQTNFIVLLIFLVINAFVGMKKIATQILHAMKQMDNVIA
jgi:hypothetical protein